MKQAHSEYDRMSKAPVPRLLLSLALPAMSSMLLTSLCSLVETFLVADMGAESTAAVGVVFPLSALIQATGFTLGMGGGSLISLYLGKSQVDDASHIAATSFYLSLLVGILIAACLFWQDPLLQLLGAGDAVLPNAKAYSFFLFLAAPFMTASFCLSHLLRGEGKTLTALKAAAVSSSVFLLLAYLLRNWIGIQGISLATLLSQAICLFLLLRAYRPKKQGLSLRPCRPYRTGSILLTGSPSLLRQGLVCLSAILLNRHAAAFGDETVAALSISGKLFLLVFTLMLGYAQGLQPLLGFNYAQGKMDRMKKASLFCLWTGTTACFLFGILAFLLAPWLVSFFTMDEQVKEIAIFSLRAGALIMPLLPCSSITNLAYQAIKRPFTASFLASTRQGIFFIPFLLLLPGLFGVQTAQAFADSATFLLSLPFFIHFLRRSIQPK